MLTRLESSIGESGKHDRHEHPMPVDIVSFLSLPEYFDAVFDEIV